MKNKIWAKRSYLIMSHSSEVFISYARLDEKLMKRLTKHLNALVLSKHIHTWTDACLKLGNLWEPQLQEKLLSADIIILLISANYLSASYAVNKELTVAIKRGKEGQAKVVPIILSPCKWKHLEVAEFTALPPGGAPLVDSDNIDKTLAEITEKIHELALEINQKKKVCDKYPKSKSKSKSKIEKVRLLLSPKTLQNKPVIQLLAKFPHRDRVLDAAFNRAKSKFATVCSDGIVRVFNLQNHEQDLSIQIKPGSLQSISWSRTGREIATGDSGGGVRIWRDDTEVRCLPVGQAAVLGAEYDLEGKRLVVASEDGTVSLWNPRTSSSLWKKKIHKKPVNSVRFNHLGNHIVSSSSDGSAVVLNTANGDELYRFSGHKDEAKIAIFVPTDLDQETTCMSADTDGRLLLWSITDPDLNVEIAKHAFWVRALTCSSEGDYVVSGGYDASLKLIDLRTGNIFESVSVDQGPIYCVRLSLDGQLLVVSADLYTYLFSVDR